MDPIAKKSLSSILGAILGIILLLLTLLHWNRTAVSSPVLFRPTSESEVLSHKPWFTSRVLDLLAVDPETFKNFTESDGLLQLFRYPQPPASEEVVKQPPPPRPPPPPDPPTRSVEVSYRGLFQDSRGEVYLYLLIEEETKIHLIGDAFLLDWSISEAHSSHVIAERSDGHTIEIPFNGKKSFAVENPEQPERL